MLKNRINLEVCANSMESAMTAQSGGAIRVELCQNLSEGGTTPSMAHIMVTRIVIHIDLYVLIRPRGGDFLYSDNEFEIMKMDAEACGKAECNGIVIGVLNKDGTVDKKRCRELVEIASYYKMGVTFHRAFDRSNNLFQALEDVIETGCERILTSGGRRSALEGAETIYKLIDQAEGRISIMPGAGISEDNISELAKRTGLTEFHGTFLSVQPGNMNYFSSSFPNLEQEYLIHSTDLERVKSAIKNANKQ